MTAPVVSVVIPTRNRLSLLAQTLHTVLAQAVELEVIVVDEGSSDATPGWLARQGDPRVRTIRHDEPHGLPAARNAGAAQARGRWVAFVDDDDLWLPDKLEAQLATADEHGRVWAYGGALDVTSEPHLLRVVTPGDADDLPWRNVVPGGGSNVVVQREALEAAGLFDESLRKVEDWDLWIRLGQLSPPAVTRTPWWPTGSTQATCRGTSRRWSRASRCSTGATGTSVRAAAWTGTTSTAGWVPPRCGRVTGGLLVDSPRPPDAPATRARCGATSVPACRSRSGRRSASRQFTRRCSTGSDHGRWFRGLRARRTGCVPRCR
jgi:hypothetical protein